ncbi:hypothetical protein HMPREF0063_11214 [Aeromicrobium marinum DSM 15272]|uniref:Polyketide cyclase/dehydrase n=1 Tax=Aeromicrobium marinum DSM 15272 TaxID=585531 RepID=E2SB05_9ACTN|nr:hypothetical protein [Aeromicrobium marinum]EFQ83551.1 hypothetical protein HMPREF0063_11214 [Aeromicrobium marinum DSM 15272]
MGRQHVVTRESVVPAAADDVWSRAVTFDGIDHELRPWLSMTVPAGADGLSLDSVVPPHRVGRSWVRMFGVVPVDFDDITIAEVGPGRRFLERSRMFSAPVWQHERTVEPVDDHSCRVRDELTFEPRRGAGWVAPRVVGALFTHRHRRLVAHWSVRPSG